MQASIERSHVVRFGVFEVDKRARELRKAGSRIRLQDQPFQILALLVDRPGDVVTREELRQRLWPSNVYVDFDHGLNNAIGRLREALGDVAATPRFIETLPRLGYRFIYPLQDVAASIGASIDQAPARSPSPDSVARSAEVLAPHPVAESVDAADASPLLDRARPSITSHAKRGALIVAGLIVAVPAVGLLIVLSLTRQEGNETPTLATLPKEPSIAVLPFVNMSSDVENEHFADGLSEELLHKLTRIRGLKVVGRTSSFYFKDKQQPPAVIAQTLKVNHLLEGSVRRSGSRVRITAQLIDARDGYHRWSQVFDRDFTDIFEIQEDIARAVATELQVKLLGEDELRLRKRGTRDPEAYRLYLTARAQMWGFRPDGLSAAKQLLEQALARDPDYAAAHAALAQYHYHGAATTLIDVEDGARLGQAAAERAVTLDPDSSDALEAAANFELWRYRFRGDYQAYSQAQRNFRRAVELDPSNAFALFDYGRSVHWYQPDLALSLFERAQEIDPLLHYAEIMTALVLSNRGQHDAARKRFEDLINRYSNQPVVYAAFGISEKKVGRLDEAVALLRRSRPISHLGPRLELWSAYMAMGDSVGAREALQHLGDSELAKALREAASLSMDGRYGDAFESLDRRRGEFTVSRVLDLPAARFALIAGKPERAKAILEQRLPDLARGVEPVNALNVLPALDLAAAWKSGHEDVAARQLLDRIAAFLDGPAAPRLPLFVFVRARTYALAGELELAYQALDRAYEAGFRTTWGADMTVTNVSSLYMNPIEVEPGVSALHGDPRWATWLDRVRIDNHRQLARVREHEAARPVASVNMH